MPAFRIMMLLRTRYGRFCVDTLYRVLTRFGKSANFDFLVTFGRPMRPLPIAEVWSKTDGSNERYGQIEVLELSERSEDPVR